jgi:hypothetical protein
MAERRAAQGWWNGQGARVHIVLCTLFVLFVLFVKAVETVRGPCTEARGGCPAARPACLRL